MVNERTGNEQVSLVPRVQGNVGAKNSDRPSQRPSWVVAKKSAGGAGHHGPKKSPIPDARQVRAKLVEVE